MMQAQNGQILNWYRQTYYACMYDPSSVPNSTEIYIYIVNVSNCDEHIQKNISKSSITGIQEARELQTETVADLFIITIYKSIHNRGSRYSASHQILLTSFQNTELFIDKSASLSLSLTMCLCLLLMRLTAYLYAALQTSFAGQTKHPSKDSQPQPKSQYGRVSNRTNMVLPARHFFWSIAFNEKTEQSSI